MLDFWFRPQREPLDMIELRLSVIISVVIEHMTKCHNLISWLGFIDPIPWFALISSILWSDLIDSYFLIQFSYFESDFLPFTFLWKVVKDAPNHIPNNCIGQSQTEC